ncbi:MAG: hypothetical protein AB7P99_13135 [Vicinamibacterales bacterium]|uniref:hypothetical protein n=1 Tax=Ramlibacter sp. TaxID=1917967 RepID=UPI003D0D8C82
MSKPCKLQMNNSGAWKDIVRFDASEDERTDDLLNAAAQLADVVNDGEKKPYMTLRVVSDERIPAVLMRYVGREAGWRDAKTGEPA